MNFVVRGFATLGVLAVFAVGFQNCGKPVDLNMASASSTPSSNTLVQEGWSSAQLVNSWTNYGGTWGPASYFKDSMGVVHLRGLVANGAITSCVFNLPVGYRPAYNAMFSVRYYTASGDAGIRLDVRASDGCVYTPSATVSPISYLSLEGVTFLAEQ